MMASDVFGPVPSRRLRRSLGMDLVPFKTCSYDYICCQLGRTTNRTIERMMEDPIQFRAEIQGQYWLEVFPLSGHNVADADIQKLANRVEEIKPDRVQLNTVIRPRAEEFAARVKQQRLYGLAALFTPRAEGIADSSRGSSTASILGRAFENGRGSIQDSRSPPASCLASRNAVAECGASSPWTTTRLPSRTTVAGTPSSNSNTFQSSGSSISNRSPEMSL